MDLGNSQTDLIPCSLPIRRKKKNARLQLHFRDRTEVSTVIKYFTFASNVLFWIIGLSLLAIGIWAFAQKDAAINMSTLGESFINPVLLLLISGSVIFIIGFFGCIGALRENAFLIVLYIVCVGITLLLILSGAIIVFVFRNSVKSHLLESPIKTTIAQYRDDPDLQNLIDWIQRDWLHCCGLKNYKDWEQNVYFNCSSPGVEACGVPYSCCLPNRDPNIVQVNFECGYNVRKEIIGNDPATVIYTEGCINQGDEWFQLYMVPVAGVIVAVALIQIIGICCASNLYSDIKRQKTKWKQQQRMVVTEPLA